MRSPGSTLDIIILIRYSVVLLLPYVCLSYICFYFFNLFRLIQFSCLSQNKKKTTKSRAGSPTTITNTTSIITSVGWMAAVIRTEEFINDPLEAI